MATVFRRNNTRYWQAAFFLPDGSRVYRTTKKTRRSEAVVAAAEMERAHRRTAGADDQETRKVMAILEEAGESAVRGTLTGSSARQFLNRLVKNATGAELVTHTVSGWLGEWLEGKRRSKSEATYIKYEGVIRSFLRFLKPARRDAPLESLSIAEIRAYRDRLFDEGRSAGTVNSAVKILRAPLNAARRQGLVAHNPAEAVEMISAGEAAGKDVFTTGQIAKLLATASGDWKGLILAGYYTGARLGDLSSLRWASVDLERKSLDFTQSKTKKGIEIPLHPSLESWLANEAVPPAKEDDPLFPSLCGVGSRGRNGLSLQFSKIMENAGVRGSILKANGDMGRNRSSLSFHSLRHSFNSAMANAGVAQEVRQRLTGHASKAMNDRYTHTELETLRRAVGAVPPVG